MNDADVALFHRAEQLAGSGQTLEAYPLFCTLQARHPEQIEILFWIVQTTPNIIESRQTLDTIKQLQPNHWMIPRTEAFHQRKMETTPAYVPPGPVLSCQYCGNRVPARTKWSISVGGWIWFAAWFVLFLGVGFDRVPLAQVDNMGRTAIFCLVVGIIGLFAIRKRTYLCGSCGAKITDVG